MIHLLLYALSICTFFKDEAPYLKEWIEYHRMIGFEHFWLYNNNSTDNYLDVLLPYLQDGVVELIEWPSRPGKRWDVIQEVAYKDALHRTRGKTTWLAVIDSDEFIIPKYGKEDFLKRMHTFEKTKDCGGVILFWHMFGTSHIYDIPQGATQLETLLHCATPTPWHMEHVKTIFRPERVDYVHIHVCDYFSKYRHYRIDGVAGDPAPLQPQVPDEAVWINHYWTRTQKYWDEVKVPRREILQPKFTEEDLEFYERHLNEYYDDTALLYVPELREKLR